MPKKLETFSQTARRILALSQEIAEELKIQHIEPELLLLAMTQLETSDAFAILEEFDIIASKLRPFMDSAIFPEFELMNENHPNYPQLDLAEGTKRVLELSVVSARRLGIHSINTSNLLIGLVRHKSDNMSKILAHFDVEGKDIIKFSESYAIKGDTLEQQAQMEYLAQLDAESVGCFGQILNSLGLRNNDDE